MPGIYVVTSIPLVRRTRATLRRAEFGFLGVWVNTRVQTPRRCGEPCRAGVFVLENFVVRPWRTNCWIVGTRQPLQTLERPGFGMRRSGKAQRAGPCNVRGAPGPAATLVSTPTHAVSVPTRNWRSPRPAREAPATSWTRRPEAPQCRTDQA